MSALARELEEARKRAGDAEEAAYALRMTLAASERDAAFWHTECRTIEVERDRAREVIAAVEAALPGCTGDLARDVAGLVATLREHEIALARARRLVEWECTARQEARDGLVALLDACDGSTYDVGFACGVARELVASWTAKAEPAPQPERLQLCTPEAPEITCAECGGAGRVDAGPQRATRGNAGFDTKACVACRGWGVRDALTVGDPVHVRLDDRAAVGRIGRSPTDGTLEAWRVEADDGREVYAREADIERVAVKP